MIHAQALCDETVEIGERTFVWQFASVIRRAKIGRHCSIGACSIVDGAIIGDNCAIGHGAAINPGTKIGDSVFIGPTVVVCNDMWPSVDKEGFELPTGTRFTVIIEDEASIGAGAQILPGVRIGKGAMVAAGAIVSSDVPPGAVYMRNDYKAPQRPANWRERRMRYVA